MRMIITGLALAALAFAAPALAGDADKAADAAKATAEKEMPDVQAKPPAEAGQATKASAKAGDEMAEAAKTAKKAGE